jgi:hypothetical protein
MPHVLGTCLIDELLICSCFLLSHALTLMILHIAVMCSHLMKSLSEASGLRAQINYQDALLHCFAGEWSEALASLRAAKVVFKRMAEHKRWRECTFAESFCLYFLGQFKPSLDSLEELIQSTLADGDAYYECNALYWKCLNLLCVEGQSPPHFCVLCSLLCSLLCSAHGLSLIDAMCVCVCVCICYVYSQAEAKTSKRF